MWQDSKGGSKLVTILLSQVLRKIQQNFIEGNPSTPAKVLDRSLKWY